MSIAVVESLVDKLRSGQFSDAITAAQRASDMQQEQMCLRPDGTVKKADPHTAFVSPEPLVAERHDPEDELKKLREARKAQLQKESLWKKQGHGSLQELADEKAFVETIAPHERALLLLDDGRSVAGEECRKALGRLARKHLETQFCWLPADRAFFLTQMVDLEALPTIFALSYGEVVRPSAEKLKAIEELKAAIRAAANKPKPKRKETEELVLFCQCVKSLAGGSEIFSQIKDILPRIGENHLGPLMGIKRPAPRPVVQKPSAPPVATANRVIGRVKSYNTRKGFGFITVPDFPRDIFVYNSHLIGRIGLLAGETVSFDLVVEGGRPQARNARGLPDCFVV
ncbi:Txndc9 [Symbiodinium pilosum]|uniref:Txndc9 protein n=1 Tax=Symbiodinium pilosum TaxID=2952 RepID=A0A812M4K4_SYMPI|nr:Txndc9 [Symbiodinium pilosum]